MMQTRPVAKDLMFKLRLDAQDRERLDVVAAHYSAPAATAIRMLIKEKFDEIRPGTATDPPTDALDRMLSSPTRDESAPTALREAAAKWRHARRAFTAWRTPRQDAPVIWADQVEKETELLDRFNAYREDRGRHRQLAHGYDLVRDWYFKTMQK